MSLSLSFQLGFICSSDVQSLCGVVVLHMVCGDVYWGLGYLLSPRGQFLAHMAHLMPDSNHKIWVVSSHQ